MSNVLVEESCLQNIANAIRSKNSKTDKYMPGQMANAISNIKTTSTETEGDLQIVSPDKWSFNLIQSDNQTITFTPVAKLIHDTSNKYSSALDTNVKIEPYTGYVPGTIRKSADIETKIYTITATPAEEIASMMENGYAKVYEDGSVFYSDEKYTTRLYSLSGKILVTGMKNTAINTPSLLSSNSKITGFKNTFVTSVGMNFLESCTSLTSVDLPNLTSAGPYFLESCTSLTSVDLPNLTSVGAHFLSYCTNLRSVFLRSSVVCKLAVIRNLPSECYFYVPASIIDSYKADNVWKSISEHIKTLESIALTKISINGASKINVFYDNNVTKNYSIKYNDGVVLPEQVGVTWSITGNATITQDGVVTLNNVKAGDKITITATSVYNPSISASLAVSIISTDKDMSIDLNKGQWVDSGTQVDGHTVYKSDAGSYNVDSGASTCTINVSRYSSVTVYARSYAESNFDYLEVGPLDGTVTRSASSNVLSTKGKQSSTTYLSYTFTIEDKKQHTFQILYSKDGSGNNNDDRGYFYIVAE